MIKASDDRPAHQLVLRLTPKVEIIQPMALTVTIT